MTNDSKPAVKRERRGVQFSLRTMFVAVTVICVLLAVGLRWIAPAQRQRNAVQINAFTRLKELELGQMSISDANLAELRKALPQCRVSHNRDWWKAWPGGRKPTPDQDALYLERHRQPASTVPADSGMP